MKQRLPDILLGICVTLLTLGPCSAAAREQARPDLDAIAEEAYVYGFPLVLMGVTKRVMTNVSAPTPDGAHAPMNQLAHLRAFPDPALKLVVRPNADTLYSIAWLDLARGPILLHVPDTGGRYYVMEMVDAFTNVFASVGKRTTGTGKGDFAIVGPGFQGQLPEGVRRIKAPTNLAWLIGRIQTNGHADYPAVRALQDKIRLAPLRASPGRAAQPTRAPVDPGIDMRTPPAEQVARMDAEAFFGAMAAHLAENPPPPRDRAALRRFARLGLAPSGDFDITQLASARARALRGAVARGQARIAARAAALGVVENGWRVLRRPMGAYGTAYDVRAAVALLGLGANLPEDAVYPTTWLDAEGKPLVGEQRYRIHFPKGKTPPVHAFWSLTLYNPAGFFAPNPMNRYTLGDRSPLTWNPDGSLDLYVQHAPPRRAEASNWLPAPAGPFNLTLRLYWPKAEVLSSAWKPPPVRREDRARARR